MDWMTMGAFAVVVLVGEIRLRATRRRLEALEAATGVKPDEADELA